VWDTGAGTFDPFIELFGYFEGGGGEREEEDTMLRRPEFAKGLKGIILELPQSNFEIGTSEQKKRREEGERGGA